MRTKRVDLRKSENKGILKTFSIWTERRKLGEMLLSQGLITPAQLQKALESQNQSNKPMGHILVEYAMISRKQLYLLLAWQKTTRLTAAIILCFLSLTGISKKTYASDILDIPGKITLASTPGIDQINSYPALFGADEKYSSNLKAFTKWTGMFEKLNNTASSATSNGIIQSIKAELAAYQSSSIAAMAKNVNTMMNRKKYIVDSKNWGKSDYWATPIEFMTRGGDCEDFAIAKYVALRALGVSEDRLRIAIVQDLNKNIPHAVLVVYSEKGAMILDNQEKEAKLSNQIKHYKPIFSINRQGWWLHTTPKGNENTVVASAR